jgi:hypothetical protein
LHFCNVTLVGIDPSTLARYEADRTHRHSALDDYLRDFLEWMSSGISSSQGAPERITLSAWYIPMGERGHGTLYKKLRTPVYPEVVRDVLTTLKKNARMAGLPYLVVTLAGPFVLLYVPGRSFVPGSPTALISRVFSSMGSSGDFGFSLLGCLYVDLVTLVVFLVCVVYQWSCLCHLQLYRYIVTAMLGNRQSDYVGSPSWRSGVDVVAIDQRGETKCCGRQLNVTFAHTFRRSSNEALL